MIRAVLILLAAAQLFAQPAFYSETYLSTWKAEYQPGLDADYREVVMPRLTPTERLRLTNILIEFPLFGQTRDAFEFYSLPRAKPARVVMPISSLRFFGDVCLATGWWEQQGAKGQSPVLGYISQMKYGRVPSSKGKTISLMEGAGVPPAARDNPKIADFASKCVSSGFLFILLHEIGHIVTEDPRLASQEQEMAADTFAAEIFRRLGTAPTGAVLFFSANSYVVPNRWDFSTEQDYLKYVQQSTHPLTSQRLRALSRELTMHAADYKDPNPQRGPELARYAGEEIRRLADFLDDYGVQRAIKYSYGVNAK